MKHGRYICLLILEQALSLVHQYEERQLKGTNLANFSFQYSKLPPPNLCRVFWIRPYPCLDRWDHLAPRFTSLQFTSTGLSFYQNLFLITWPQTNVWQSLLLWITGSLLTMVAILIGIFSFSSLLSNQWFCHMLSNRDSNHKVRWKKWVDDVEYLSFEDAFSRLIFGN